MNHRISTAGGGAPLWSPGGRQLFFRTSEHPHAGIMVVDVNADTTFTRSHPRTLFDSDELGQTTPIRSYDLAPDGQRFVMIRKDSSEEEPQPSTHIHVVLDWHGELNKLVPVD